MKGKAKTVDEYLAALPPEQRAVGEKLRHQILSAAPGVVELIAWGVPQFKVQGQYVAGFAAYQKHVSFAPWGGWGGLIDESQLAGHEHTAATIHVTPDRPLPDALVTRLVRARIQVNQAPKKRKQGQHLATPDVR